MKKHLASLRALTSLTALFLVTFFYIIFTCYTMYRLGDSTTQLYQYPYTVSNEAKRMKTNLYSMRLTLPALLTTPGVSLAEMENILQQQMSRQLEALNKIKEVFRGSPEELLELEQSLTDLQQARTHMINAMFGTLDFEKVNAYYEAEVLPYFERMENILDTMSDSALQRGDGILLGMDKLRTVSIVITLLMGILLIWMIFHTNKLEKDKNAERIYRERLFNLLADNIDEVFFIFNGKNSFEYASSNSKRIIGISAEELCQDARLLHSFLSEEDIAWLYATFSDDSQEMLEKNVVLGQENRRFNIRVYHLRQKDIPNLCIAVLTDKTEELAYRQTLVDALESAHNASAAKSSFLSHMSHEIRTPMNAIIGMTTIAMSRLDDRARVEDCLAKISMSSRHLLGLINDVLDMSKIESGKLSVVHEPFNFQMALQGVINLIQPQTLERGQDFEVSLSGVEEEELIGDALRVNQVLINILSNALKFTPVGGSIRLEVHQLYKENNTVRFRFVIRDTGIGMSQESLNRLYTPFEQATTSTSSKFGGTGLGMAITKNLVSLLGGTIFVKSKEHQGTEFTVELPFGLSEQQLATPRPHMRPLKVLVVDDDRDTCEHATLLLEKMGLQTHWVLSGAEAIKLVKEAHDRGEDYDVCFIDWKMPDMDGAETCRYIRNEVGQEPLLIIISAYDYGNVEEECRAIGVNAFIPKPFFASNLYSTLTALTQHDVTPRAEAAASAPQNAETGTAESRNYDFTGKHILLVEDNEFNREIAQEFLEMTGATVECAEDGSEAVRMFKASSPGQYDIILMDVQMPIMDGYEATRTIRALEGHPDANTIPILAMTANAFSEDVSAAMAAGMNGHIAKPIDMTKLYQMLNSYLNP